jgi:amphi-Trp domain-containing protein
MSEANEFKHESLQDCDSIVKYLQAIGDGFSKGNLSLANGGEGMRLEPSGLLRLDLKAKRKDGRIKLSLKISWKEPEETPEVDAHPLKIEHRKD